MKLPLFGEKKPWDQYEGVVYRVVIWTGTCNLGQLIGVYSPTPEKTLDEYLKRNAVGITEAPRRMDNMDPMHQHVDIVLQHHKSSPHYAVVNRLKQTPLEGLLTESR